MQRRNLKSRSKNSIYKNSYGELWCTCGNRLHIYGFYPCNDMGIPRYDLDEGEFYRCDQCGSFVREADAEIKEEPKP
jgi:hypothetical protein